MTSASRNHGVGKKPTSQGAVDRRPNPVRIGIVNDPAEVPIDFESLRLGHARGGIQQGLGHIDQAKHIQVKKLSDLVSIVPPADEPDILGFTVPEHLLQAV